ncbi:hypothetical protein MD484_g5003, partial [Candolleomyces efflorescens]
MFPPSSPIQPQSPNSQLTMQLLGSLMQLQGLDNNYPSPQNPGFAGGGGAAQGTIGSYGAPPFGNALNLGSMAGNANGSLNMSGNDPSFSNQVPNGHPPPTAALLEQQIKLQQLQQLQQLQNQIFQQQIALISGQSPPNNQMPTPSSSADFNHGQQQNCVPNNATSPSFTALPTPGPSNELRPRQPPLDFDNFPQPLPSPMSSHTHHGMPFSDDFIQRGTNSAPEHIAFHIRTGPSPSPQLAGGSRQDVDLDISPLTSPWLGAVYGNVSRPTDTENSHDPSIRHSDQRLPNKRGPPVNGDDISIARKKHSSGLQSFPESGMQSTNASGSGRRTYQHRGSKSTTSTPLLGGSRSRSKSSVGKAFATSPMTFAPAGGHNIDGVPPLPGSNNVPTDTPSPVDLSMPPPPAPSTVPQDPSRSSDNGANALNQDEQFPGPQQLTPLTPGVVMKISFNPGAGTTPASQGPTTRNSRSKSKSEAAGKPSKNASGPNSGSNLKNILPAGPSSSSPAATSESSGPPKKVSHKDAEQKRRDSQKTAYDELRRLLPPITFEDDQEEQGGTMKKRDEVIPVRGPLPPGALPPRGPPKAGGEGPNKGVSKLQLLICGNQYIRTLKGRVERRDGEIAKLRREVGRLRRKTTTLEGRMERMRISGVDDHEGGNGMEVDYFAEEEEEEEDIDLEKDLDAIEGMGVHIGLVGEYEDDGEDGEQGGS